LLEDFLILLVGCVVMVFLAHWIIKRSVEITEHFGFSGMFVGMTLLSIGTSLPEILTHIIGSVQIVKQPALMNQVSALILGSNVGSDIFQQNFVLGAIAILGTIFIVKEDVIPDIGGLIGGTFVLFLACLDGFISKWEGIFLVVGYLTYLVYLKRKEKEEETSKQKLAVPEMQKSKISENRVFWTKKQSFLISESKTESFGKQGFSEKQVEKKKLDKREAALSLIILVISFIAMTIIARQVLTSAENLVNNLAISASFFGVIILGIAAAMPELTTALEALRKKESGMSAGILLGSNVTNPMFAVGLGAIISTYTVPGVIIWYDLPVKLLSCLLILFFFLKYKRLEKHLGVILIGMFLLYLIVRILFFSVDTF